MAGESENLRIQIQINQALTERNKILTTQSEVLSGQLKTSMEMLKATNPEAYDRISSSVENTRRQLEAAAKAAADIGTNGEAARKAQEDAAKAAKAANEQYESGKKRLEAMAKAASDFNDGFSKGVSSGVEQVKMLGGAIGSVISGIFNIGMAILAIPFKIFDIITGKAAELASQMSAVTQALEEVREQFGDLGKATSKEVLQGSAAMSKGLNDVGLSTSRVFGMGPEGVAAQIQFSAQLAGELGAVFNQLGAQAGELGDRFILLSKGLGLAGEDLKGIVRSSLALGQDPKKAMDTFAKEAMLMRDVTGISEKQIAKDMAGMVASSGKFGRLSSKEIAKATASLRTFGLEVKEVEGIMDAFGDVETAATNAAKLQQVLGANVDIFKMMKSENPGEQFNYLRKQILATGRDLANADRHTIKYVAGITGMDENLVRSAFSAKNAGKSIEDIRKEQEKSGKTQKTQQELFEDLNKSIKRVVESLQHSGSFLDEFLTGFAEGVFRSGPMREVLRDIAQALIKVRMFGREVGKMFVEMFPGVKQMLEGLADFFNPATFQKNINSVRESLTKFFGNLSKDPKKAMEDFYKSIKEKFLDVFDPKSQASNKFFAGAKEFLKTLGGILVAGIGILIKEVANGLKEMAAFLRNPEEALEAAGEAGAGIFGQLALVLKESLPVLWGAMQELFTVFWDKYGDKVMAIFAGMVAFIIGKGMVIGIAQAAGGALVQLAVKGIGALMMKIVGTAAATQAAAGASAGGAGAITTISKSFTTIGSSMSRFSISIAAAEKHAKVALPNVRSFASSVTKMALAFIPLAAVLSLIGILLIPAIPAIITLALFAAAMSPLVNSFKGLRAADTAAAEKIMPTISRFIAKLVGTFLVAVVAFIASMMMFNTGDMMNALMALPVLFGLVGSVATLAIVLKAVGSTPMDEKSMGKIAAIMLAMTFLLIPAVSLFIYSLSSFSTEDMMNALLGVGVLAVFVIAVAGLTLAAAFAGTLMQTAGPMATTGFLMMALVSVGLLLLAPVLMGMVALFGDIPKEQWIGTAIGLGAMMVLVTAIGALTLAGAAAGLIMSMAGPLALAGFAMMGLVALGVLALIPVVFLMVKAFEGLELKAALVAAIGIGSILGGVVVVAIAAAALGAFMMFSFGLGVAAIIAGLGTMALIAGAIGTSVPPIIKNVLEATKGVGSSDDVLKRAESVAKIIGAIAGLFEPVASMAQIAKTQSGFLTNSDPRELGMLTDKLSGMITSVSLTAQRIVESIILTLKSVPKDKIPSLEAGAKLIGSFGGIISSAMSGFSNIKVDKDTLEAISQGGPALDGINKVMKTQGEQIISIMSTSGDQIKRIVDSVSEAARGLTPDQIKALPKELDIILKVIEVMSNFGNAMGSMASTQGAALDNVKKAQEAGLTDSRITNNLLNPAGNLISQLRTFLTSNNLGIKDLAGAIAGVPMIDPKKIENVIKIVGLIADQGSKLIDVTQQYANKAWDSAGATNIRLSFIGLRNVLSGEDGVEGLVSIINSTSSVNTKKVKSLEDSISAISSLADKYYTVVGREKIVGVGLNLEGMLGDIKTSMGLLGEDSLQRIMKLSGDMAPFAKNAELLVANVQSISDVYAEDTIGAAIAAVTQLNELYSKLSNIQIGDVNATIDDLVKKVSVTKSDIQVETQPINVTVNLNLTIDAERFTNSIFETGNDMMNNRTSIKLSGDAKQLFQR